MCGRVTLLRAEELDEVVEAVKRRLGMQPLGITPNDVTRDHVRVGAEAPLVVYDGGVHVDNLIWGIDAPWSNKAVFNTRIESALRSEGSNMWRNAIRSGRCIMPVATFFETHGSETVTSARTGRPVKRAYEFATPDGSPLLLASVRESGRFSVVTTEPSAIVAPVHPRMPLMLRFEEVPIWLEGNLDDIAGLADRSAFSLLAAAETPRRAGSPTAPRESAQLSLF